MKVKLKINSSNLLAAFSVLIIIVGLSLLLSSTVQDQKITISKSTGKSFYKKKAKDNWKPIKRGMQFSQNVAFKTSPNGLLQVQYRKSSIRINPNSQTTIKDIASGNKPITIKLKSGFIWNKISKLDAKQFNIMTPTIVAGIRGTSFAVSHTSNAGSMVCVCEGEVSVKGDGEEQIIKTGEGLTSGSKKINYMDMMKNGKALKSFKKFIADKPEYQNCMDCHNQSTANYGDDAVLDADYD